MVEYYAVGTPSEIGIAFGIGLFIGVGLDCLFQYYMDKKEMKK